MIYIYGMRKSKIDPRINALREYRDRSGISIRDLANAIGTTDSTLYKWLRGSKLSRLASRALDVFLKSIQDEDRISGGKR
jgi:transcriptional regulator with XRE-family HTH domain